jgi:hypothetical protein
MVPMMTRKLSPEATTILIDYARREYAAERWPLSPVLRPVKEAIAKLRPKPGPLPPAPELPYVLSRVMQKNRWR